MDNSGKQKVTVGTGIRGPGFFNNRGWDSALRYLLNISMPVTSCISLTTYYPDVSYKQINIFNMDIVELLLQDVPGGNLKCETVSKNSVESLRRWLATEV